MRCPKCTQLMLTDITYHYGKPQVNWYCKCGYTSCNETIYASDKTNYKGEQDNEKRRSDLLD